MSQPSFDVEARWPELFDQLDADKRRAVVRSLAAGWHEGWEPNREDVSDLIDYTRGALTFADSRHARPTRRRASPERPPRSDAAAVRFVGVILLPGNLRRSDRPRCCATCRVSETSRRCAATTIACRSLGALSLSCARACRLARSTAST